ncbi:MAG: hypothetical protein L0I62_00825 [Gammaproteobacteria bacterium]|nr:hypothetical protein [Gammaproteobacteria bacterium]
MTVSEFQEAGLDKLDQKQLEALNAWLSRYVQTLCSASAAEATQPAPKPAATPLATVPGKAVPTQSASTDGKTPAPTPSSADIAAFGAPEHSNGAGLDRIESRIVGVFHGWTGNTVFQLANGQVWKQAGPGYFRIDLQNPKVTIKKLLIGYVLFVQDYSAREVFVRRIR